VVIHGIGVGIVYDLIPLLQLSVEGAYRPGMSFGGDAFPAGAPALGSGWSAMVGASLKL
jgi:hypothetical protein